LSLDHKPELEVERGRILFAGGFIHAGRVNGSLNLTRAIGDVKFKYQTDLPPEKQIVTCFPDVRQVRANILLIFSFFKKNMVKALQILLQ
jgi:protein phosphatase 1G